MMVDDWQDMQWCKAGHCVECLTKSCSWPSVHCQQGIKGACQDAGYCETLGDSGMLLIGT